MPKPTYIVVSELFTKLMEGEIPELDFMEHKNIIVGVVIAIGVIILSFVVWSIATIENAEPTRHELTEEDISDADGYQDIMNKIRNKPTGEEYLSGKTEKYEWRQNDNEIDLFIPIPLTLKSKDVQVDFKLRHLCVRLSGVQVLDGPLTSEVAPDECNWQFEGSGELRKLEINLVKKVPTQSKQHWKSVLVGDEEIDTSRLAPPIHFVDSSDPSAIRRAIDKVSFS